MSYEVRIERESEELVLYFREEGTSNWRVAARKIFPAVQAARATNLQLSGVTAQELITTFEGAAGFPSAAGSVREGVRARILFPMRASPSPRPRPAQRTPTTA